MESQAMAKMYDRRYNRIVAELNIARTLNAMPTNGQ
jgi:hypothetical protein